MPTSAHTGDGMGDLISQIVKLTQTRMAQKLAYSEELQSMVLEVSRSVFSYTLYALCAKYTRLAIFFPRTIFDKFYWEMWSLVV